jgi:hypothetical protein
LNRPKNYDDIDWDIDNDKNQEGLPDETQFTEEELRKEELEIKELEGKKRTLENRVAGMEKDISGVMR